jgi:hypothetical protein
MFNPRDHIDGDGGNRLEQAGDFVLVIRSFKRDRARSGKPFLLCKHECIYGPAKGRTFLMRYYLNPESLWKLGRACESMGQTEAFDIDDNRELNAAICNKPFKGRTKVQRDGSKTYTEIALYLEDKEWTQDERDGADTWVAEHEATDDSYNGGGGYDSYDDDGFSGGYGDDPGTPQDDPGFTDDDVPF